MKTVLPWIIVVALIAGAGFLYSANKQKEGELAGFAQQTQELEQLRAENEQVKQLPALNEEVTRLRKDNTELLRLRSEVQKLREQQTQMNARLAAAQAQSVQGQQAQQRLSQLATENQSLRNQAQQAQQAQPPAELTPAQAQVNACINNLRQIDAAKQSWALENKKTGEAIPTAADIAPYLSAQVICPAGGVYTINSLQTAPTCSVPGHVLPK